MSKALYKIKKMVEEELRTIAEQGELTAETLDTVDKLTHSLKSIETIEAMDDRGYSQDYRQTWRYDDRPTRPYYRGYSRDGDQLVDRLRMMIDEASTDKDRAAIKAGISKMEG